jgi:ABC-2 type transport system permease protein
VLLTALARQEALDRRIAALGGDPGQVNREVAATRLEVSALEPQEPYHDERLAIGMIVGVLVYLALLTYGQTVAQGVVEEKTSRVVELLLSTIRAWQLMAGKVLGIGLVGLLQLAVLLGAGAIAGAATGVLTLPTSIAAGTLAWAIAWYLLGFFLYALLFAAAGALVSRQEDVGSVTMPIMLLIIVPYVIGITALPSDPDNGLAATLSLIPLFAPMLMPIREAMGAAETWELVLSVVLTLALVAVLVRATGRVYANAVMRTGARVRLGDALRGT